VVGLEQLLSRAQGFRVLASVKDAQTGVRVVRTERPDLLLLGTVPDADGHAAMRAVAAEGLPTRIVLLTADLSEGGVLHSLRLGAGGVIQKDASAAELVKCLRSVHAGEKYVSRRMLSRAYDDLLKRESATRDALASLTKREREIVKLVVSGLSNKDAAATLFISIPTVKLHLHRIYKKLGVENRVALILLSQQKDMLW
jgi:DNA-binding NarL/FixJ family response regulator